MYFFLKALAGLFGVGSIVKYVGSINEFINGFTSFMNQLAMLRANNECMKVYFDFLNIPSKMYQGTLPVEKRTDNEYEVEFRNVSFKYPSTENYALRSVSLKLKIGERLAVVGMNGSGKTTFIKLLCRLYDPTEGEILLNGIGIKKYNYDEYMSIFSVVFQDFKLFPFSLGHNVAARVDYDREKVEACLKEAGFGERYNNMENGTETCLYKDFDEKGVEISGGEAQKIALARALYKDAPFIVLDEPTAALDPIAEYEIYSKFNEIVGDKTAIYISHRLSSCRFCDDIAVSMRAELYSAAATTLLSLIQIMSFGTPRHSIIQKNSHIKVFLRREWYLSSRNGINVHTISSYGKHYNCDNYISLNLTLEHFLEHIKFNNIIIWIFLSFPITFIEIYPRLNLTTFFGEWFYCTFICELIRKNICNKIVYYTCF